MPIVYKIDATNQALGRLASHISHLLMGKDVPSYTPHKDIDTFVEVSNVLKLKVSGNKMFQKRYQHYSGYPGGLKQILLKDMWQKSPEKVLYHAVAGMLPNNKLKKLRLRRLKISK